MKGSANAPTTVARAGGGPVDLVALLPEEVSTLLAPLGEPPYRGRQVFAWVHARRAGDFDAMSDLPKGLRAWLAEHAAISRLEPRAVLDSSDGSRKALFEVPGGTIASVLMPAEDRVTLCVSSQVGCRMGCAFCLTGRMGLTRNLTAAEMVGQVLAASRLLPPGRRVTNVVFMGMGEPLDNLAEVVRAVRAITHREGLRVAPRRTTVSTVGLIPRLREFIEAGTGASVAVSLCATTDEARQAVVPIGKKYGLEDLVTVLREMRPGHGHRHTIEYLMLEGVGDSIEDARRLSRMLARFPSKVNLIPFNPWPGAPFRRPSDRAVEAFHQFLSSRGHLVTIRHSRGQDIGAACGQLGTADPNPPPDFAKR